MDIAGSLCLVTEELVVKLSLEHFMETVGFLLKVLLQMLEQVLLRPSRVIQIVPVDIRPLEHLSTSPNLPQRIIQELQLDDLEAVLVVKCLHLALHFNFLLPGELHTTIMVHEALEVEHVLIQRMLCSYAALLFLRMLAFFRLLVIDIALVVPSCRGTVSRPVTQTKPTKLVPTASSLRTHHVVATLVLLYRSVALRALLGVGPDPTNVLRLCTVLDIPGADRFALGRPMGLLTTRPALEKVATTAHLQGISTLVFDRKVAALRVRTPLHIGIVIHVRSSVPLFVLSNLALIAKLLEEVARNHKVALVLRTSSLDGCLPIIYLGVQIPRPAVWAKPMATTEAAELRHGLHANGTTARTGTRRRTGRFSPGACCGT
mmetsp:Transcript_44389/g.105135  ORF Transcript_44389/g.105135 Transcript_44389/m.105135 type:complete len:375 (-) Transcript_44389:383-1507(-)